MLHTLGNAHLHLSMCQKFTKVVNFQAGRAAIIKRKGETLKYEKERNIKFTRTSEFKHQSAYPSKDVESTSAGANT